MSDYKLKMYVISTYGTDIGMWSVFSFCKSLMKRIMYWLQRGMYCMCHRRDDTVTFYDTEEDEYVNVWKDYFDMDRDYSAIKEKLLEKDDKLKDAIESMWGVRILNQDFF